MYAYRVFEGILAESFGITEEAMPTFRSRLKYFRRLGLVQKESVGGKNIKYDFDDVFLFGFILELSEAGVDPQRIEQIAYGVWPSVKRELRINGPSEDEDVYFAALPVMLSALIVENLREVEHNIAGLSPIDRQFPRFVYHRSEISDHIGRRAILINISSLRARLDAALLKLA